MEPCFYRFSYLKLRWRVQSQAKMIVGYSAMQKHAFVAQSITFCKNDGLVFGNKIRKIAIFQF